MKKSLVITIIGLFIFFFNLFPQSILATSWAYPFVVWDGFVYQVTDEPVEEVGEKIGEVTAYSDMESLSGNFSNAYQEGTHYYSIAGTDSADVIAVEVTGDQYVKAYREHEYQTSGLNGDPGMKIGIAALIFITLFIGVTAFQFRKISRNRSG
ncbi:hypothetical protein [Jeotgalibacillus terrae]|uniref:Uncharacterized protein n=1 Tax=Jeotgalibacillus terrae TaxID=587735 RepID=A0ABW5ZHH0_9BACL|nr:hypothetical protein [Jeotgalibacillus terrae]MBM7579406.1 hypothetical protein [Jeotgalibacillus terrae]